MVEVELPNIEPLSFTQLGLLIGLCQERREHLRAEIRTRLEREAKDIEMELVDNGAAKPSKRKNSKHPPAS